MLGERDRDRQCARDAKLRWIKVAAAIRARRAIFGAARGAAARTLQ